MFPLYIPAISMAGGILLSRYGNQKKGIPQNRKPGLPAAKNYSNAVNPLEIIFKNLAASLPHAKKENGENYQAAIRRFMPPDSKILVPKFPSNSKAIHIADIDGDSQNEVIASYRYNREIKTIIIKKQNNQWYKIGEIINSDHDELNFRDTVSINGNGKQLLLGLSTKGNAAMLYGYAFNDKSIIELFSRSYHKFELFKLKQPGSRSSYDVQLAFWDRKDQNTYDIEVLDLKNSELKPADNPADYYYKNVVPFYLNRVKRTPYAPSDWYCLANALIKSRAFKDAKIAIDIGTKIDKGSVFAERFSAIRNEISGK